MHMWQPIETAPRDRPILAWCDTHYQVIVYDNNDGDGYWWWHNLAGDREFPTHWMPLPAPPPRQKEGKMRIPKGSDPIECNQCGKLPVFNYNGNEYRLECERCGNKTEWFKSSQVAIAVWERDNRQGPH